MVFHPQIYGAIIFSATRKIKYQVRHNKSVGRNFFIRIIFLFVSGSQRIVVSGQSQEENMYQAHGILNNFIIRG
jgi:hypothetical protein